MTRILVEVPGMLTSVQDLGREGYGPIGVSPSGAADPVALRIGNLLVGNAPGAAALEMTLTGGTFAFTDSAEVALTGADFGGTMNGHAFEMWSTHTVNAGDRLVLGGTRGGARCYLCVAGGIAVEPLMESASTHLLSGLGGHEGRALKKGDALEIGARASPGASGDAGSGAGAPLRPRRVAKRMLEALEPRKMLRVTRGPQAEWFTDVARKVLLERVFTVSEQSNRMGIRLDGPMLELEKPLEMISEGVSLGAIQVTPSGQAIILFVEQQTAGGYPKIANVIGADTHCVGQLRPRDEVRFEIVSMETARDLWIEQEELLGSPDRLFA